MLIELRIRPGDFRFRSVMRAVKETRLVHQGKVHGVPHLSIYGNADVPYGKMPELRKRVASVCERYRTLPYVVDGYVAKEGDNGKVIAFQVVPSSELLSFRNELVKSLRKDFPSRKPWDRSDRSPWFHIAIAYGLTDGEAGRVWEYLKGGGSTGNFGSQPQHVRRANPYMPLDGLRVTILGRVIDREFDLPRQRVLTRNEALDWREWCRTYRAFRVREGIELEKPGWLRRLTRASQEQELYFISDLHLDHGNIIRYCARPFCRDVKEMNRVLVNNWNYLVRDSDRIYFLGDLTYGRERKPSNYWWPRLKGEKFFVKGNHDDNSVAGIANDRFSVRDEKEKDTKNFAVVHDPNEMPHELRSWVEANNAWTIHGDKHNNNLRDYPFINGEKRRINACVEVTDCKPVSLSFLLSLGLSSVKRMDTIRASPVRS